jgi:hypothetical protein
MRLIATLILGIASIASAQVSSSPAFFSPLLGTRTYPGVAPETAERFVRAEAQMRCSIPGTPMECRALATTLFYGLAVFVRNADGDVRSYEVSVRYVDENGTPQERSEYTKRTGDISLLFLWGGKISNPIISAIPLKASGPAIN